MIRAPQNLNAVLYSAARCLTVVLILAVAQVPIVVLVVEAKFVELVVVVLITIAVVVAVVVVLVIAGVVIPLVLLVMAIVMTITKVPDRRAILSLQVFSAGNTHLPSHTSMRLPPRLARLMCGLDTPCDQSLVQIPRARAVRIRSQYPCTLEGEQVK